MRAAVNKQAGDARTVQVGGPVVRYGLLHPGGLSVFLNQAPEGGVDTWLKLKDDGNFRSGRVLRIDIDPDD